MFRLQFAISLLCFRIVINLSNFFALPGIRIQADHLQGDLGVLVLVMDARSAMRPCYILPMFFYIFFMAALVGQTAERIFTKLTHVVDIRRYLRTY